MKKFTLFILLILPHFLLAQEFHIEEKKVPTDDVSVDAWVITIGGDVKFAKDAFADYAKETLDIKAKNDGKLKLNAEKVSVPSIAEKRGDLKVIFSPRGDSLEAAVAFLLGYDIFLNPEDYPDEMAKLREFTKGYWKYYYANQYEEVIEQNEKILKGLNKDLQKSERKIEKLKKDIARNNRKITKEDDEVKRSRMYDENAKSELEIQELTDMIPQMREEIIKFEANISRARATMNQLENQIEKGEQKIKDQEIKEEKEPETTLQEEN